MASISRDCWPPEKVAAAALEFGRAEAEAGKDFFDAMIDAVCILMFDLAVDLVVTLLGALLVVVVLGFGELLGGFLELVLEVQERGQP